MSGYTLEQSLTSSWLSTILPEFVILDMHQEKTGTLKSEF